MAITQNEPIYALEPVVHLGDHFEPGEEIPNCDENDIGAILSSGRGTQDKDMADVARKNYVAAQKAAAASAKAAEQAAISPLANAIAEAIAQATRPAVQ